VARSDAELYDVEEPRWAKRVYITVEDDKGRRYVGFVNIRALKLFWRRLDSDKQQYLNVQTPREGDLICSAYLSPPKHLVDDNFRFPVSVDLGVYFNELGGFKGTVFASPVKIWGGMCSQACVYMASYSVIEHGARVLGVSDITFAASGKASDIGEKDILITGLNSSNIVGVFPGFLRLNAFMERLVFKGKNSGNDEWLLNRQACVLASYLDQGFPIILLVKVSHLVDLYPHVYSSDVLEKFANWTNKMKDNPDENLHAILLVGYRPAGPDNRLYEFVYHDSLSVPYMRIPMDKLGDIAFDSVEGKGKPYAFEFIVPLPEYVHTPLAQNITKQQENGNNKNIDIRSSIFDSSLHYKSEIQAYETSIIISDDDQELQQPSSYRGYFQLKCPGKESKFCLVTRKDFFHRYVSLNVDDREKEFEAWCAFETRLPEAFWVEELGKACDPTHIRIADRAIPGFWAWSAETNTFDEYYQKPLLQAAQGMLMIDCKTAHPFIHLKRGLNVLDVRKSHPLQIGAITSFHVGPLVEALRVLAFHRIQYVDLFAFQIDDIIKYYGASTGDSPLENVSSSAKSPMTIAEQIARDVHIVSREMSHNFFINGFATYFPEISSVNKKEREKAVNALLNIIRIAGVLRKDYGFDSRYVEIVAGTKLSDPRVATKRMEIPGRTMKKKKTVVLAKKADYKQKFLYLCDSLSQLSKAAHENDVYIAVEIEPGVLPFLSRPEDIELLTAYLDGEYENASKLVCPGRIGLNIDVSHMWICEVDSNLFKNKRCRDYITHAHIGDIGPGHMCDLVPGTVHSYEDYEPWLDMFNSIANELPRSTEHLPDFSCCLSVELEACRNPQMIGSAYYRARNMLTQYSRKSLQAI